MDLNDIKTELEEIKKLTLLDEIPHYRNGHGIWFKREDIEAWQLKVKHNVIAIK